MGPPTCQLTPNGRIEAVIEVLLDEGRWPQVQGELERAVKAACRALGAEEGEVSVALLDDSSMTELNRAHLGHDYPTDVIAFALHEGEEPVLGDVYVGVEQASRQAGEAGVSLREELVRLVIHGTLHVLGMEHPEAADARQASPMYQRQEALVREVLKGR